MSTSTPNLIDMDTITEDEAIDLAVRLFRRFRWVGSFYTVSDLRTWWTEDFKRDDMDAPELTDELLEEVLSTYEWRKGIDEVTGEDIGSLVSDLIFSVRRKHNLL